jgi:predicted nucleic acid-binding Zn ribbon protein
MKKHHCIDCKKEISKHTPYSDSKRCNSCENKRRHKIGIIDALLLAFAGLKEV